MDYHGYHAFCLVEDSSCFEMLLISTLHFCVYNDTRRFFAGIPDDVNRIAKDFGETVRFG